jgi:hypothetical protein
MNPAPETRAGHRRGRVAAAATVLACTLASCAVAEVVSFEDVVLPPSGYLNGDPGDLQPGESVTVPLVSGSVSFSNTYGIDVYGEYTYPYWFGFAFSDVVNTTDGTWDNQYASYPGGGHESTNYAVAYADGATIALPSPSAVAGFWIANTTYARSTMVSADPEQFASPLGPPAGYFRVTATGLLGGSITGSAEFFLADFAGPAPPGVLGGWAWFSLTGLGAIDSVSFAFDGSDVGDYGLNTAAYFAMDDFTYAPVPEPTAVALAAVGVAMQVVRLRRRHAGGRVRFAVPIDESLA